MASPGCLFLDCAFRWLSNSVMPKWYARLSSWIGRVIETSQTSCKRSEVEGWRVSIKEARTSVCWKLSLENHHISRSIMSVNSAKGELRIVGEGRGGTFTFDANSEYEIERVQHIGVEGLYTCIGVYWPVDDRRCFCAHVNIQFIYDGADYKLHPNVQLESEVAWIKDQVKSLLEEERVRSGWGDIPEAYRKQAILMCPDLGSNREVKGIKSVGLCVVEALKEWLDLPDLEIDKANAASVVKHGAGVVESLAYSPDKAPTWDDWTRIEETGQHVGIWDISVPRGVIL